MMSSIDFRCASVSFSRSTMRGLFHQPFCALTPPKARSNGGLCPPGPPGPPPNPWAPALRPDNKIPANAKANVPAILAFIAFSFVPGTG
jgi:hypothetical protein